MNIKLYPCLILIIGVILSVGACAQQSTPSPQPAASAPKTSTPVSAPTQKASTAAIAPVTLKLASPFGPPEVSMANEAARIWAELVKERTGGAITVDPHYSNSLAKDAENVDITSQGLVDLTMTAPTKQAGRWPMTMIAHVFVFGPSDPVLLRSAIKQLWTEFPEYYQDLEKENLKQLSVYGTAQYNILSKTPVTKIEDFQGKKVSLFGEYFGKAVQAIGGTPVAANASERYEMLRSGVTDIDILTYDLAYDSKLQELMKYSVNAGLFANCDYAIYINLKRFNSFPPEVQKILLDAGDEAGNLAASKLIPDYVNNKTLPAWKQAGIQFSDLSESERKRWQDALPDIPAQWAADLESKGLPGWDMVKRWQEITANLGFKWLRQWGIKK